MTKEPHQPKAVNIIRPSSNHYLNHSLSHSSSGSTTSTNSQRRSTVSSTSSTNTARKPRVTATNVVKPIEKPHLNLYHPPVRKPSYDSNKPPPSSTRPPIEIYKPQSQLQQLQQPQQRIMTKSMTVPLNLNYHEPPKLIHSRPMSPSYIRSPQQTQQQQLQQQQQQQHHRSVLGIINTPVAATAVPSIIHSDTLSSPEMIDTNTTTSSSSSSLVSVNQDIDGEEDVDEEQDIVSEKKEPEEGEEEDEEEEPVINEARVNRKIADLELSIKSLLTVNAMLEATVRKQASQLNQVKKQRLGEHDLISDEIVDDTCDQIDEDDGEEEEDWEQDVLFQKLRKITEHMIEQGQKSIDFEYKILGRVLSNYAPEEEEDDDDDDDEEEEESIQPSSITTTETIPMTIKSSIPRKTKR